MELTPTRARRMALAAQGLADPRPSGRIDRRHARRVFDRVGLIQIDSVNVLVRSQELPLFARLGPHPRDLIPAMTADGELFEYIGHEAAHIPSSMYHLFHGRMRRARDGDMWPGIVRMQRDHPGFVDEIYQAVAERGPLVAGDVRTRVGPKGTWWDWDDSKIALE